MAPALELWVRPGKDGRALICLSKGTGSGKPHLSRCLAGLRAGRCVTTGKP